MVAMERWQEIIDDGPIRVGSDDLEWRLGCQVTTFFEVEYLMDKVTIAD